MAALWTLRPDSQRETVLAPRRRRQGEVGRGEVEALADGADLVGRQQGVLLAVNGDGVFAEASGVLVTEEDLAALGAAQVGGGGHGDLLAVHR